MDSEKRILIASVTAPIVGIIVAVVLGRLPPWGEPTAEPFLFTLGVFLVVGAPGAYILEAALGIPVYRWMKRRNAITLVPVLVTGSVAGALAFVLPAALMGAGEWGSAPPTFGELSMTSLLGAIGGLAAAAWFWFVYWWRRREGAA